MKGILQRLKEGEVLLSDGAMGTMLIERGLESGQCPERINLDNPGMLEEIARLYIDAGSDIVQTNTFGASALRLADYGLDDRTEEINAAAVQAVKKVAGGSACVSGSCGPCTKMLKPYGDTDAEDVAASFERQISALVRAGVDMICIETMMDLEEAAIAVRTAKSISENITVAATMTFGPAQHGFVTVMGTGIEDAARGLIDAGADIIGSNCGNGIENMIEIAAGFREITEMPLIVQSNAGLPELKNGALVYTETPGFMADKSHKLMDLGVNIIGGCCGTNPEHIKELRKALDAYMRS